jgi:hypothetical protein
MNEVTTLGQQVRVNKHVLRHFNGPFPGIRSRKVLNLKSLAHALGRAQLIE